MANVGTQLAILTNKPAPKLEAMRIGTRCKSIEEFVAMFKRFVHDTCCFIPSLDTRAIGTETAFSIRLADGTPVLRGLCVVLDAWKTPLNPWKRPGVYIGVQRLTADSVPVFQQLQAAAIAAGNVEPPRRDSPPPIPKLPKLSKGTEPPQNAKPAAEEEDPAQAFAEGTPAKVEVQPVEAAPDEAVHDPTAPTKMPATLQAKYEIETRAPGSGWVLPANPFTDMTDENLEAFIECSVYEDLEDAKPTADDVLALPKDAAPMEAAEPIVVQAPTLASKLADSKPTGREAMSTLLGVAPLVVTKVEAPIVTPTQTPKPFRATPPVATPVVVDPDAASGGFEVKREAPPRRQTAPVIEVQEQTPPPAPPPMAPVVVAAAPLVAPVAATPAKVLGKQEAIIAIAVALALILVVFLATKSSTKPAAPVVQQPLQQQQQLAPPPAPPQQQPVEPPVATGSAVAPEIDMSQDPVKPPAPAPTKCQIKIATTPPGAWVRVDSVYAGKSPITVDGPCKRRKVEIAATRYETIHKYVVPDTSGPAELDIVLKREAKAVTPPPKPPPPVKTTPPLKTPPPPKTTPPKKKPAGGGTINI